MDNKPATMPVYPLDVPVSVPAARPDHNVASDPVTCDRPIASFVHHNAAAYEFIQFHFRFGHLNYEDLLHALMIGEIKGFKHSPRMVHIKQLPKCPVCLRTKAQHLPSVSHVGTFPACRRGLRFHTDNKTMGIRSYHHFFYWVPFVDDNARKAWIYFLRRKSDYLRHALMPFYNEVCLPAGITYFELRLDNGGEMVSHEVETFCHERGIRLHPVPPHSQYRNGVAESLIKTRMMMTRPMMTTARLPGMLWEFAVAYANRVSNAMPHAPSWKSNNFRWNGAVTKCDDFRVFGCLCFRTIENPDGTLGDRGEEVRFLGYVDNDSCDNCYVYRACDHRVLTSRHLTFVETDYQLDASPYNVEEVLSELGDLDSDGCSHIDAQAERADADSYSAREMPGQVTPLHHDYLSLDATAEPSTQLNDSVVEPPVETERASSDPASHGWSDRKSLSEVTSPPTRRALRSHQTYVSGHRPTDDSDSDRTDQESITIGESSVSNVKIPPRKGVKPAVQRGKRATPVQKPEARPDQPSNRQHGSTHKTTSMSQMLISLLALSAVNVCDFDSVPPSDMFDYSKFACFDEPLSTAEALRAPDRDFWCDAMREEVDSFYDNGTWKVVMIDPTWNLLRSRWVYKRKLRKDGSIERYRARLVAKGFQQRSGVDYGEIFSPVVRYSTIRVILALCAHYGLMKRHFDAPKAFTQAELDTPCYMKAPPCVRLPKGHCFQLKKSVYGLKQASNCWFNLVRDFLVSVGFTQCQSDVCLFWIDRNSDFVILTVYVDDMLCCGNSVSLCDAVYDMLHKKFKVTDLGDFTWCFGIQIATSPDRHTVQMIFSQYIAKLMTRFEIDHMSVLATPMLHIEKLSKSDCPTTDEEKATMAKFPFRSAISSLLWIMLIGRLDISFPVISCSRFTANPGKPHWDAVIRIFRYLKGTADVRLTYSRAPNVDKPLLFAYTDADWGTSDVDERRSVIGYIVVLSGGPIAWKTKFGPIALSTMEAEFYGCNDASKDVLGERNILLDLPPIHFDSSPTTIVSDSTAAVAATQNSRMTGRCRHIEIKQRFCQHLVKTSKVRFQAIPRSLNLADMMVKAMDKKTHRQFMFHVFGPNMTIDINYTDAENLSRANRKRSLE
jgi:hypothetical protein